jgi:Uma2 family endonuclease
MNPASTMPVSPPSVLFPMSGERLLTVADLAALPPELPSGPVRYELDNGRLIIMPPPGDIHGGVEANFIGSYLYEGQKLGHGKARCGEVGIVLWRNPDRVVGADGAFITNASLPIRQSPEGYLETIPELILEVMSKNDSVPAVESKVGDYLRAGVRVVLVANPATRMVTAYRLGQTPQIFQETDMLSVDDVLPGLQVPVAELFNS